MPDLFMRPVTDGDHATVWSMLSPVFQAGETYAVDPAISREDALAFWCGGSHSAWLACQDDQVLGSYYIGPNQAGGGAHVANCGFVTAPAAQGRGVARAMLDHALDQARQAGYRAMQFNFVIASNIRAVKLWKENGFEVVGRLPRAFRHPHLGYVDALVMFREL